MKAIFRRHPVLMTAFILATLAALYFAIRMTMALVFWQAHENEPIRPWMTVGYISKSWDLNPREIDEVAGLPPPIDHPFTLSEIAHQRGVPVEQIIAEIEAAIAEIKAETHAGQHGHSTP